MTPEDVGAYRKQLELKIHGKYVPKLIKTWHQTGFTNKILETIKKLDYEKPMPIQAQALAIIMSGRDCIGIAKTGSGKTLANVLPMLRHIKDHPPVFARALGHSCAQQTAELKWGAAFVVCTPCRVIDLLCTNGGRIKNMQRVIYMVVDEADRMFDLGFELQINQIVQNIRSDHQTVLFSATFPHQAKVLACVLGGVTLPGTAAVVPGIGLALVGHKWVARAAEIAAAMNLQHNVAKIQVDALPEHFEAELEINDIPQNARWKLERSTENKPIGMISCQMSENPHFINLKAYMCFRIKRCERGVILQFEGMFCLGIGGADELPFKKNLLLVELLAIMGY
ncbi:hypothetical protein ACFXTO_024194 [Malus domestica]